MKLLDFAQKINTITEKSALKEAIVSFVNTPPSIMTEIEGSKIELFIDSISKEAFTSFGQNLGFCKKYCLDELDSEGKNGDNSYIQKLNAVKNELDNLLKIYQKIIDKRDGEKAECEVPYTLEQQRDVLKEMVSETKKLKNDVEKVNNEITDANKSLDGKMFSLLTNTVAILGIFVAIAFTGLGSMSIFSNIDLKTALISTDAFLKNIFFLLFVSTMVYNLLIVLIYFIFKLSRPLTKASNDSNSQSTFNETIKLNSFFGIDGVLVALTIAAFVASLIV